MMMLMVVTVGYMPLVLPLVLSGVSVSALAIAKALLLQMLLPIAVGMLAASILPSVSKRLQPLVGTLGNIAMYLMVVATLIGYFPNLLQILGTGAFLVGLLFVAASFGLGYLAGFGKDHLEDVGGLGTAQRNTAAGVIIAIQNFKDPNVFVMLTLANILGIVMLLILARFLSRDNKVKLETL
jgi:BASS family bile acid:Na+ symporter